ncbi:MAG: glycosyltransferase family 4 protein [Ahrensia sp.]|nr:glycosyltransferase family 4 protein [Ahrensia sp.]
MAVFRNFDELEVIAPNFKRRLSGVTSTIIQLIPAQRAAGLEIAVLGEGLPDTLPKIRYRDLWRLLKRPLSGKKRVWHARRNVEMLCGIILRDMLRMPLKLVFTSASQRKHKAYTKWLITKMDSVIATSAKTATYLSVPNTIIMHGIDADRFSPVDDKMAAKQAVGLPTDKKIVGCFGRIRAQKGSDLFIDAMILALQSNPSWIAILAGRATLEHAAFQKDMEARIANAGMVDRIIFVGEHTDIERWYQALDLFIAPQRWEGFGLTPLEAMSCGVPVIATNVGAFDELIIEGSTGYILENFEASIMAEQAIIMMRDDTLRQKMSLGCRQHIVSKFSLSREVEQLNSVYRQVLQGAN